MTDQPKFVKEETLLKDPGRGPVINCRCYSRNENDVKNLNDFQDDSVGTLLAFFLMGFVFWILVALSATSVIWYLTTME